MNEWERYHAMQRQQAQTAEALHLDGHVPSGTPLIIPQVAGLTQNGWETALQQAIADAERDMIELQGDWFDQPACLEPIT